MGASLEELVEAGGLGRADSSWNVGIGHTVLLMFTDSDRKAPTSTGPARRERKKKNGTSQHFHPLVHVPLAHPLVP